MEDLWQEDEYWVDSQPSLWVRFLQWLLVGVVGGIGLAVFLFFALVVVSGTVLTGTFVLSLQ